MRNRCYKMRTVSVKIRDIDKDYLYGKGDISASVRTIIKKCIDEGFGERYPIDSRLELVTFKISDDELERINDHIKNKGYASFSEFVRCCIQYHVTEMRKRNDNFIAKVEKIKLL